MTGKTLTSKVHFNTGTRSRKEMKTGANPPSRPHRLPRVTKLMALAIRFEKLIQSGVVKDYAELARLGHVTRARITQIMNLLLLAPEIQESLLHLPEVTEGRDEITLSQLQSMTQEPDWKKQREMWKL